MSGNRQFGIRFYHKDCSSKFSDLLEAACQLCTNKQSFRSFSDLRTHVRKEHNRQYCDICVDHLHIFPSEFEVYTRQDLVKHRKSGDVGKSVSFRGHPLCVFCDERYFDNDELLSHLRKNHFWCHFCEKDGKQDYYCNYNELRDHFRDGHFLCEEDKCRHEQFTSVFRSKIDLQAHKLATHSNKLTKAAAKQARQLDIDIDYGSRRKSKRGVASVPETQDVSGSQACGSDDVTRRTGNQPINSTTPLSELAVAAAASEVYHSVNIVPNPLSQESSLAQKENAPPVQPTAPPTKSVPAKPPPTTNSANVKKDPPTFASKIVNGSPKNNPRAKSAAAGSWSDVGQPPRLVNESNFPSLSSTYPTAPKPSRAPPGFADTVKRSEPPGLAGAGARPKTTVSNQKDPKLIDPNTSDNTDRVLSAPARPPGLADGASVEEKSFQARNQRLIQTISSLMSNDDFTKFRILSGQYRKGEVSGSHYYNEIKILLGENHNSVFSELVDLLPDEKKQSELLSLHKDSKIVSRTVSPTKNGKKSKERKSKTPTPEASSYGFENDFPALPPTQQKKKFTSNVVRSVPASNAWTKRK